MVLSCVPWIFLQKSCLTLQCTHLHNLPFNICTCRSSHFFVVWYLYLLGVPGDLWLCCLPWNTLPLHVSCRCFCSFLPGLLYKVLQYRACWYCCCCCCYWSLCSFSSGFGWWWLYSRPTRDTYIFLEHDADDLLLSVIGWWNIVLALCLRVLMALNFADRWW